MRRTSILWWACLAAGCSSAAIDTPPRPQGMCGDASPGPALQRRLSNAEYDATVHDLLGTELTPARDFLSDPRSHGFTNNGELLTVGEPLAQQYLSAAEKLAIEALGRMDQLVPCAASHQDRACAGDFIVSFGARAYRRPLTAEETGILLAVYDSAAEGGTFADGLQDVITAMLVAPQFLYHSETSGAGGRQVVRLSGYELASRLSYLITGSMPDAELFAAAADGRLLTQAGIDAQVDRLLTLPGARLAVGRLMREWLRIDTFANVPKNGDAFPTFTPAIRAAMQAEADAFLEHVFWEEDGDLGEIFGAHFSYRDPELNAFLAGPPLAGEGVQRVELDPLRSAGILTNAAFASVNAGPTEGNPVKRGRFVRETLFDQPLPDPPVDLEIVVPPPDPTLSTRQRFAAHQADPVCASCHTLMDPIGFAFENLDGVGRWQDSENGVPLTGVGELTGTDVDGPFTGLVELGDKLAHSETVRKAIVQGWFRYAYGRAATAEDQCAVSFLEQELASTGSLRALFVALTRTDTFLFRSVETSP